MDIYKYIRGGGTDLAGLVLARPLFGGQVMNVQNVRMHIYIVHVPLNLVQVAKKIVSGNESRQRWFGFFP